MFANHKSGGGGGGLYNGLCTDTCQFSVQHSTEYGNLPDT